MSNAIKVFMSVARAVPTILWVLVFSVAIGLGPEAAVIGLLFHSVAYLVKAYSESFEEVDAGVLEALRASGASWWQVVFQGVVPEKVNEMLSWTFIRFEINFVNAVAVGAVAGAGGIGYQLFLAGSFYYNIHEVGLIVYLCLAVALESWPPSCAIATWCNVGGGRKMLRYRRTRALVEGDAWRVREIVREAEAAVGVGGIAVLDEPNEELVMLQVRETARGRRSRLGGRS